MRCGYSWKPNSSQKLSWRYQNARKDVNIYCNEAIKIRDFNEDFRVGVRLSRQWDDSLFRINSCCLKDNLFSAVSLLLRVLFGWCDCIAFKRCTLSFICSSYNSTTCRNIEQATFMLATGLKPASSLDAHWLTVTFLQLQTGLCFSMFTVIPSQVISRRSSFVSSPI